MALKHIRDKLAEKAREIDHERFLVMCKLHYARVEVRKLELQASELAKQHLKAVQDVFSTEDLDSKRIVKELTQSDRSFIRIAIIKLFEAMKVNPFDIPKKEFYNIRSVVMWWVCREIPGRNRSDMFRAWQDVVGAQEQSSMTPVNNMLPRVENPVNDGIRKWKEAVTQLEWSDLHQEPPKS